MRRAQLLMLSAGLSMFAMLAQVAPAAAKSPRPTTTTSTYDVSYPQCGLRLPSGGTTGIVGVTNGLPWSTNPCLASEYSWAAAKTLPAQLYMNTANPETASSNWQARASTGPRTCANLADPGDLGCAYNYGWNSASDALSRAIGAVGTAAATRRWWLDVETANSWNGSTAANAQDLQASVDYLSGAGAPAVGFYSTSYQWGVITGGYVAPAGPGGVPSDWIAGAGSQAQARSWCAPSYSFSGGVVRLVQYPSNNLDGDWVC